MIRQQENWPRCFWRFLLSNLFPEHTHSLLIITQYIVWRRELAENGQMLATCVCVRGTPDDQPMTSPMSWIFVFLISWLVDEIPTFVKSVLSLHSLQPSLLIELFIPTPCDNSFIDTMVRQGGSVYLSSFIRFHHKNFLKFDFVLRDAYCPLQLHV